MIQTQTFNVLVVVLMVISINAFELNHNIIKAKEKVDPPNPAEPPPPSISPLGFYYDTAVTSNCAPCAVIGRDVLLDGGSAVDAAIAVLFCDGVACLQSMGLGGGFVMTIYNGTTQEVTTLNARETAPAAAHEDMYEGNPELSITGGLAVATPGELKGYWEAHKKFGKLPWNRLVEPTIQVCEEGSIITSYQAALFQSIEEDIRKSETLSEILINSTTGALLGAGDRIVRQGLAETLRTIAEEGGNSLYSGSLAQAFVNDIQDLGGIITLEDLANYEVRWEDPVMIPLSDNLKAYSVPAPGAGPLIALMLNVLDGFITAEDSVTTHHRMIETMKWAYGQRTMMGDPHFINIEDLLANLTSKDFAMQVRQQIDDTQTYNDPEHYGAQTEGVENHGTAHVSILASDGSAVSATSTINYYLGAKIRTRRTDIILNDEMNDFSSPNVTNIYGVPPSPENFIVPGKRPVSSMCPTIVVNSSGDVRLVVGASGGTKITSAVSWVLVRNLWFKETVKEAIDAPRIHHQLFPMQAQYEFGNTQDVVVGLESIGHETIRFEVGGASANAIARGIDYITANADFRREAKIAGY